VLGLFLGLLLGSPLSLVSAQSLRVDGSAERMRVDGSLREWRGARFTSLGSGSDAALRFALATADGGLYVGADVTDERLIRKSAAGSGQDALVLTLALPDDAGNLRALEIWLHPGETGRSKAVAALGAPGARPTPSRDVLIVEGPREQGEGYVIEAFIPFRLVPRSELWEQGRGALRFEDVDSASKGRVETVVSSTPATRAADLPRLALGQGQKDLLGTFLSAQGLSGVEPHFDLRGQVHGDGKPERVVIVDRYVVVYGPGYKQGEAFGYAALPLGMGGGVKSAELVDLTKDGLSELVMVLRQRNELGAREVWSVYALDGEAPRLTFGIETRKEARGGFIENTLRVSKKGRGAPRIELEVSRASLGPDTYQEGRASDVQPILLPWEEVRARTYQHDGARFAMIAERRDPKAVTQPTARAPEPRERVEEAQPIAPSIGAVLALFKQERGLAASEKPRRHLRANLTGGKALEEVFLFGTQLAIVGPDIGAGAGYFAFAVPAASTRDVLHLGAADVTRDGRAELFVRVRQPLGGAQGVSREVVLVQRFDEEGRFVRVLSVEAFRSRGPEHIANEVKTQRGKLVITPGHATGFTPESYPFADEPVGGVGKLLLPWKDKPVTYRFVAGQLVPQ
jgi:hypothetical protein